MYRGFCWSRFKLSDTVKNGGLCLDFSDEVFMGAGKLRKSTRDLQSVPAPPSTGFIPVSGIKVYISGKNPRIFLGNLREISRFSRGHKNLVRKLQKLLRPVLKSPARALSDGVACCSPCSICLFFRFSLNPKVQYAYSTVYWVRT